MGKVFDDVDHTINRASAGYCQGRTIRTWIALSPFIIFVRMLHADPSKLPRGFYERPSIQVARDLLGTTLVHRRLGNEYRAKIVETEAYVGEHDLACHASKGRTKRTEIMFGPGGHAYVYFIYGMYDMLNVVCSTHGDAQAVLIRAAEPLNFQGDLSGPGKLCRDMRITVKDNAEDFTGERLFFMERTDPAPRISKGPRIGVDYAGLVWREKPLRFFIPNNPFVSRPAGRRAKKVKS